MSFSGFQGIYQTPINFIVFLTQGAKKIISIQNSCKYSTFLGKNK